MVKGPHCINVVQILPSFVFTVSGFTEKGRKSDSEGQLTDSCIIKKDTENV